MGDTKIAWTKGDDGSLGKTWNPIRGCSRVSAGCVNCYAEKVAARFGGTDPRTGKQMPYAGLTDRHGRWNGRVSLVEEHLGDPLRWKKPRRIFVNSMSDLFHENVSDEWRDQIFAVMALASQHTFQVLTKRPERMRAYLSRLDVGLRWMTQAGISSYPDSNHDKAITWSNDGLPNVMLGVSVENQETADKRIPLLLDTPAAVRFVSLEPQLGPVDLTQWLGGYKSNDKQRKDVSSISSNWHLPLQQWGDSQNQEVDRGEPDRNSSLLERNQSQESSKIDIRRLSDDTVFGREDSTQGIPSSSSMDDRKSGGHSRFYASESQKRDSERLQTGKSGSRDPIAECFGHSSPEKLDPRPGLDWIIVGGESGPNARPFDIEWARSTVRQCKAAGTKCFVKQMGAKAYDDSARSHWENDFRGRAWLHFKDRAGADPSEWPDDLRVQEFPGEVRT